MRRIKGQEQRNKHNKEVLKNWGIVDTTATVVAEEEKMSKEQMQEIITKLMSDLQNDKTKGEELKALTEKDLILTDGAIRGLMVLNQRIEEASKSASPEGTASV